MSPSSSCFRNGRVAVKPCRHGAMMFNVNDMYIGRSLDLYGEWCESEMETLSQMVGEGDVVLDVGANIGTHTVFLANRVGRAGTVHAFEPQPYNFVLLGANCVINGFENVQCHNIGLGDTPREMTMRLLDPGEANNFGGVGLEEDGAEGRKVMISTVDALGLDACGLIKIDVEGMEREVLRGADDTIGRLRPGLFVENNSLTGTAADLILELLDRDYRCWWHIADYFNANNFLGCEENVFESDLPEANMICIPREVDVEMNGFEEARVGDHWKKALDRMLRR